MFRDHHILFSQKKETEGSSDIQAIDSLSDSNLRLGRLERERERERERRERERGVDRELQFIAAELPN